MSQQENILNYLRQGNKITPIEALNKFGCFRLSAVIFDIKADGVAVHTEMVEKNGKSFAEYSLYSEQT